MSTSRRTWAAAVLTSFALLGAGCGGDSTSSAGGSTSGSSGGVHGAVTVFAAASLTESFTDLGKKFEAANPGVKLTFSFGPSSGLAEQIIQGAPADVFASASAKNMTQVTAAGDASDPKTFAKNVMEIVVPPGNPAKVAGVDDLAKPAVKVALCQAAVPCGAVAAQVFKKAGVTVHPVTEEADVKSVLSKVQLGEVDAGMVYVTDVKAAGAKVTGVPVPDAVNASTSYPIATIKTSTNSAAAQAFVDFVLSATGAAALAAAGFQAP